MDPLTIYREGRAMGDTIGKDKRYMYQVFLIYNGTSEKYTLPVKFCEEGWFNMIMRKNWIYRRGDVYLADCGVWRGSIQG